MRANDDNWRPGPDKRADAFELAFCGDPTCGLHLVARDARGAVICEVVMSADQTRRVITACQDHLYDKAVRRTP